MKPSLKIIAMALCAATAPASAQPAGSIDEMARTPIVTVRIAETLRSPPNEATLSLSTESKAPTAAAALADNKIKTERLLAAVRAGGTCASAKVALAIFERTVSRSARSSRLSRSSASMRRRVALVAMSAAIKG